VDTYDKPEAAANDDHASPAQVQGGSFPVSVAAVFRTSTGSLVDAADTPVHVAGRCDRG
jgi:hypothetical protein